MSKRKVQKPASRQRPANRPDCVRVFAPASVANVIVGFDFMGFAVDALGDVVTVTKSRVPGVRITSIRAKNQAVVKNQAEAKNAVDDFSQIPLVAENNTATAGVIDFIREQKMNFGFDIQIEKGIPLGSGLGGSAASAVAAIVGVNEFLRRPLPRADLLRYAVTGEAIASGARHADNVAPSLLGGFLLAAPEGEEVLRLPVPAGWRMAVLHPGFRLDTRLARQALPANIPLKTGVLMASRAAMVVAGLHQKKADVVIQYLRDDVIEPARASLIPNFHEIKAAALKAGAHVCSISGAGPTIFAIGSDKTVQKILAAMRAASANPTLCRGWVCRPSPVGAKILR